MSDDRYKAFVEFGSDSPNASKYKETFDDVDDFELLYATVTESILRDATPNTEGMYHIKTDRPNYLIGLFSDKWLLRNDPEPSKLVNFNLTELTPQDGGARKAPKKLKKSSEKVKVGNVARVVYVGPRGGKYVKVKGQFVSVKKI